MKIIISHDVDHLQLSEHWCDTFVPGLAWRSIRSVARGQIPLTAMVKRFSWRLNRIKELHAFNRRHGVPATYFFGMRTGLNLSYHWRAAKKYTDFLQNAGVGIGLHGMAFDDIEQLGEEKQRLEEILESPIEGIRNHYLRLTDNTLSYMNQLGFKYDSTKSGLELPSRCGDLMEIPVSLMDVQLARKQSCKLTGWIDESWARINEAEIRELPYFVINFHDVYFSSGYPTYKIWYQNMVEALRQRGYAFVTFQTALGELGQ